jgi:AcrR family transcriptional regulator
MRIMSEGTAAESHWRTASDPVLTPILAGALEAFSATGYHGTTVRDIAGRVGVTVPALYYHHPNKEAILLALLVQATEDIAWRVEAAAGEAGDDPRQALRNIVEAIAIHSTRRQKLAILDFEARYLSADSQAMYGVARRRIENVMTRVVEDGTKRGIFATAQPREASRALLGALQWITRWYHPDGELSVSTIAERYGCLASAIVEDGGTKY